MSDITTHLAKHAGTLFEATCNGRCAIIPVTESVDERNYETRSYLPPAMVADDVPCVVIDVPGREVLSGGVVRMVTLITVTLPAVYKGRVVLVPESARLLLRAFGVIPARMVELVGRGRHSGVTQELLCVEVEGG